MSDFCEICITHGKRCAAHEVEYLQREIAQRDALLANQKELIMHLYKQLDEVGK